MDEQTLSHGRVYEGLEGVVVSATRLSHVDGEHGRLVVAGQHIEQLAEQLDFEGACALLWAASGYDVSHVRDSNRGANKHRRARTFGRGA